MVLQKNGRVCTLLPTGPSIRLWYTAAFVRTIRDTPLLDQCAHSRVTEQ